MDELRFDELRESNVSRCNAHYHHLDDWSLLDWANAVGGEYGEMCNVIKKMRRIRSRLAGPAAFLAQPMEEPTPVERQRLADEIADQVIYLDLLAARMGIDLGEAVRNKFNEVSHNRLNSKILLLSE